MKLVVVESPAKAKTIEKYLGPGHRVLASYGHVRDLPPKDGSVDPDDGFAMEWETYPDKARQVKAIADEAKKAETLILATDPDREGEAISWHVQELLRKRKALPAKVERVTFNAITKSAVTEAMAQPARARRGSDRRLPGAPGARLSGRLHLVADPVAQAARRQVGGPGAVGGAAPDRRPRARDRAVQAPRNIGRCRPISRRTASRSRRGWSALDGKKIDRLTIGNKGERRRRQGGGRGRPLHRRVGRDQAVRTQPAAALHHLDAAAGSGAQAGLRRQPHDADRATAL